MGADALTHAGFANAIICRLLLSRVTLRHAQPANPLTEQGRAVLEAFLMLRRL